MSFALLVVALAALPAPAADPVDVFGSTLTPLPSMRRVDGSLLLGSVALVPLVAGEAPRRLLAAFSESSEGAAATLTVGRVDRALELDPGVKSAVASAIAGHFRGELDLEVVVDRPVAVGSRLEARAHTRLGRGLRTVRFAFVPAGGVHYVLTASLPAEREAELEEGVSRAFDSFLPAVVQAPPTGHNVPLRAAAFGAAGLLVAVLLRLWRRRRKASPAADVPSQGP
jgi:hypothetical protein